MAEATKQDLPYAKGLAKCGLEESRGQGGGAEELLTLERVSRQSGLGHPLFPGLHQGVSLQILPGFPPTHPTPTSSRPGQWSGLGHRLLTCEAGRSSCLASIPRIAGTSVSWSPHLVILTTCSPTGTVLRDSRDLLFEIQTLPPSNPQPPQAHPEMHQIGGSISGLSWTAVCFC